MGKKNSKIYTFADFLEFHKNEPVYWCQCSIRAGFDLLVSLKSKYNFDSDVTEKLINLELEKNMHMFQKEETSLFYYPNDNMFSHDNSVYHISGLVLHLKKEYGGYR